MHIGVTGMARSWSCVQRVLCKIPSVAQFEWRISGQARPWLKTNNVSTTCKQILREEEPASFNCCIVTGDGDNDDDADN